MKIRVLYENERAQIYSLSNIMKFNFELFNRLEEADLNWEFI